MKLLLNPKSPSTTQVCFFHTKPKAKKLSFCSCSNPHIKDDLSEQFSNKSLKASFGEMRFYRSLEGAHELYVGLGELGKLSGEQVRELAAKIHKSMKSENVDHFKVSLDAIPFTDKSQLLQCLAEGFLLTSYKFSTFKSDGPSEEMAIDFVTKKNNASLKKALEQGQIVGEGVNFTRWLGDCPGNFMNPTQLAEEAKKAAKGTALKVSAWNKARIEKEKMDSLIGVSNGSDQEPRFIMMEYKGAAASKKPICFVGKGLTFDAGGISLKPSAGMEEMKYDMCGGSAVIGAMVTIAKLKLKVNVIAYVPASENMPGPSANKPGDIRKARNGKTIEVNNTDAEGRLILADALSYASEKKPAWIMDAATLTGAMVIALGNTHTGFYTRDKKMRDLFMKAGEAAGEEVWPMPLCDHHTNDMKGHYADLTNLAPSRAAGSATAAAFLENFVEKDIPWLHIDVAGTAWHVGRRLGYAPVKGASGVMVRTFVELARRHK